MREQAFVSNTVAKGVAEHMADADLMRFVEAQAPVLEQVTAELIAGNKHTHWMWFIFPQIAGLGHSPVAQHYAIQDVGQAKRYLADPILGQRLRDHVRLMLHQKTKSAQTILGSPDDLKFRSCLTLFRVAASDASDLALFTQALEQFFGGNPDARTLAILEMGDGRRKTT